MIATTASTKRDAPELALRRHRTGDAISSGVKPCIIHTSQPPLSHVHYFTTRIRSNGHNAADAKRQNTYLDALATLPALTRHEGHYLEKTRRCRSCGATWPDYEEKMTDVNIASQLLVDAFDDCYDTAIIMSGDSDLTTPVRRVRERFPNKRVVIAQPPNRHSQELNRAANGFFSIGEDKLRNSQLPNQVVSKTGYPLLRPAHWA